MRIRKIVSGTQAQPRMTVYRSNKQIYVQFIDDLAGTTLAAASSLEFSEHDGLYEITVGSGSSSSVILVRKG